MGIIEILLTGVALSMDAFAASVCKGLGMCRLNIKHTLVIGIFFGGFQALMPTLGYLIGGIFYEYISRFGHWISFALLAFIGIKALIDAIKERGQDVCETDTRIKFGEMLILAIATSIDAFAVGVTFSLISVNIVLAVTLIGCTTFVLSVIAVIIGHLVGTKYRTPARIIGGIILIILGIKILVEGLIG